MIVKYDVTKQYVPEALENKVRRMSQTPMEMTYQKRLISNRVLLFLVNLPVIKQTLQISMMAGRNLLKKIDKKLLLITKNSEVKL